MIVICLQFQVLHLFIVSVFFCQAVKQCLIEETYKNIGCAKEELIVDDIPIFTRTPKDACVCVCVRKLSACVRDTYLGSFLCKNLH